MKKTFVSIFLAIIMVLSIALVSCKETTKPSLFDQSGDASKEIGTSVKDALEATSKSIYDESPILKVLQAALSSGTITFGINDEK